MREPTAECRSPGKPGGRNSANADRRDYIVHARAEPNLGPADDPKTSSHRGARVAATGPRTDRYYGPHGHPHRAAGGSHAWTHR